MEKIQEKIIIALKLEMGYKKNLSEYDFENKNYNQKKDYMDQCSVKYQGLLAMKQLFQSKYQENTTEFIEPDALNKINIAINQIGKLYLEEIKKCIETNF